MRKEDKSTIIEQIAATAVSYTHLDVYKRQAIGERSSSTRQERGRAE